MTPLSEMSYKKATQALNFFALKKDGKINKMKAIKLIYLADRLHLRKYGRPIVGDKYFAMKYGPVGSVTLNIANLSHKLSKNTILYAKRYVKPIDKKTFASAHPLETNLFSKTDMECLESIYKEFSDKDQFELADITHTYSEWLKHEKRLDSGSKSVKMDYDDFFIDIEKKGTIFYQGKEILNGAKDVFIESQQVNKFFAQ